MDYDELVIGSGSGGSVTAQRLTQKDHRVRVPEAGRHLDEQTLPKTSRWLKDFLLIRQLGRTGILRLHLLRGKNSAGILVIAGAGVGQPGRFFEAPAWARFSAEKPSWRSTTTRPKGSSAS